VIDSVGGGGVGRVPEEIRDMRRRVVERNGGRLDDVEFTFRGGYGAKTLGEATLKNRVKSHPDVGERWYPDILKQIREQQRIEREDSAQKSISAQNSAALAGAISKTVEAH
jgi:hypothetical protein